MKRVFKTIILAIVAIAFLVWAISCDTGSLAWFPGFIMSVFCCMRILDINKVGQNKSERNSR